MLNPLDPVKWGVHATFAVTSTVVKIGMNAVRTAELLLGRDHVDEDEQRYRPVATTFAREERRPPPPEPEPPFTPAPPPVTPRGARRQIDVSAPTPESRAEHIVEEPDALVESEGAAAPHARLHVDAPWEGYDAMTATDVVKRVRGGDAATKAVVRLYEQTHKKRKSVLAATR